MPNAADHATDVVKTHAIILRRHGGPEALQWETMHVAAPGPGEALVAHTVVGLNYIDVYHRVGLYPLPLPLVPGVEAVGVVEAVGPGVSNIGVGDRVAYAGPVGAYAEKRLVAADRLVPVPAEVSDDVAAAGLLKAMTVDILLRKVYAVVEGDTILVHAAAGGVGLLLCQWAASLGAIVIGTVSTDEKAELVRGYGCSHPIVHTREDFVARVRELTDSAKLPVVYDSVGNDTFMRSLDCLRHGGLMVSYGQSSGAVAPLDIGILAKKGSLYVTRPTLATFVEDPVTLRETAAEAFARIASNRLRVAVNHRYPLPDAAQAHSDLQARRTTGSIVLTVDQP
jgi:NADPH2:quinone reductase